MQRSGIDTIKYHTWPRIPMGKWQTHSYTPKKGHNSVKILRMISKFETGTVYSNALIFCKLRMKWMHFSKSIDRKPKVTTRLTTTPTQRGSRFKRRCYISNIKALGLLSSGKNIFKVFIPRIYFSLFDLFIQKTGTIWTFIKADHMRNISARFDQTMQLVYYWSNCWRHTADGGHLRITKIRGSDKL